MWLLLVALFFIGVPSVSAQNPYYDHGTFPTPSSPATSQAMRAEFDRIEAGFDKLPILLNNQKKFVVVNSTGTALIATDAPIPRGTTFPASPSADSLFIITSDSTAGACDGAGGTARTLCWSDGTTWSVLGGTGSSGGSLQNAFLLGSDITSANDLISSFGVGDGTDTLRMFKDQTSGLQFICVVGGVANACNYVRQLNAGFYSEIQNSSGAPIFHLDESTGALTSVTLDTEASGNTITLKNYKWYPAAGCNGASAASVWDLPSSNPAVAVCRTGTNTTKGVLEFADGANALTAQLTEFLVEDWSGAIDAIVVWQSGSTSTNNVVWQLAIACASDGDSDDPAFTDDVFTADANKASANQYNLTASNTITTTGSCAANDVAHLRIKRDPAHASDTLAATAQLVGVYLKTRQAQ